LREGRCGEQAAQEKEPADYRANLILSMNPSWLSSAPFAKVLRPSSSGGDRRLPADIW
jgi:hypothetical protein